ncbi:NAD-dependent epimerase/dehydratase family protein [Azospirillum palustre]
MTPRPLIYLIGGNGFVGSAYRRLFAARGMDCVLVGRDDIERLRGTRCDVLINANGNSKKFLADRDPLFDFDASVRSVMESLVAFDAGSYVFLSSGDVYPDPSSPETTGEDQAIDLARVSRYGLHKHLAEQLVMASRRPWLVLRMGGFVGPGLKKNAVYDMLNGDPVWLSPESRLQFIHTDHAADLVWRLVERGVRNEVVNLGAEGLVHLGDLHREIGGEIGGEMGAGSVFREDAAVVRYELSLEKLRRLSGTSLPSSMDDVRRFVAEHRSAAA